MFNHTGTVLQKMPDQRYLPERQPFRIIYQADNFYQLNHIYRCDEKIRSAPKSINFIDRRSFRRLVTFTARGSEDPVSAPARAQT